MRMRHIVICELPCSTIFFHSISYAARFSGEKNGEQKMCVSIFYTTFFLQHFSLQEELS